MYDFNGDGVLYALVIVKCNQLCSVLVVCGKGALITLGSKVQIISNSIYCEYTSGQQNYYGWQYKKKVLEVHEYC